MKLNSSRQQATRRASGLFRDVCKKTEAFCIGNGEENKGI